MSRLLLQEEKRSLLVRLRKAATGELEQPANASPAKASSLSPSRKPSQEAQSRASPEREADEEASTAASAGSVQVGALHNMVATSCGLFT